MESSSTPAAVAAGRRPGAGAPARGRAGRRVRAARNGSLGAVFDHVAIAVSDLAASERFYRTVLSVLGVEPSHADAELVEWEDWDDPPVGCRHRWASRSS
jgi:hypothetical protein